MRLVIRENPESASECVADYIIAQIKAHEESSEKPFVLGLPTGSTPLHVYRLLAQRYKEGRISFRRVVTFNLDEYVGIPREHPESYHTFMFENFFSHVDFDPRNINILNGNALDLRFECESYEEKINRAGGIDLLLAGVGPDGHIAFNEPGSSLRSRTRVKMLTDDTIVANARFFDNEVDKVPRMALTMGVGTILDAREVIGIITGRHKAVALKRCVEDGLNHMWTLSCLQVHPNALIVVDEDATLELQVKTVKYFKDVEKDFEVSGFRRGFCPTNFEISQMWSYATQIKQSKEMPSAGSELLCAPILSIGRQGTPELIPDRMASRIEV